MKHRAIDAMTDAIGELETMTGTFIAARERVKNLVGERDDLLASLKELVATIDSLGQQGGEKMERARAAIEKAEGR
jgi:uncharacterized coiled-coil DUF342 family protein